MVVVIFLVTAYFARVFSSMSRLLVLSSDDGNTMMNLHVPCGHHRRRAERRRLKTNRSRDYCHRHSLTCRFKTSMTTAVVSSRLIYSSNVETIFAWSCPLNGPRCNTIYRERRTKRQPILGFVRGILGRVISAVMSPKLIGVTVHLGVSVAIVVATTLLLRQSADLPL